MHTGITTEIRVHFDQFGVESTGQTNTQRLTTVMAAIMMKRVKHGRGHANVLEQDDIVYPANSELGSSGFIR